MPGNRKALKESRYCILGISIRQQLVYQDEFEGFWTLGKISQFRHRGFVGFNVKGTNLSQRMLNG